MKFEPLDIPEVILIEPDVFYDERGFFMETRQERKFAEAGISFSFVQDNHSLSVAGTLRGIHYQVKKPQGKLIRAIRGEVFDVAVDLRRSSLTFGKWTGRMLSAENRRMIWIPPGFGHGFYVVDGEAEVVYACTDYYAPECERTIVWNDLDLDINWPLVEGVSLLVSDKDRSGKSFRDAECYP